MESIRGTELIRGLVKLKVYQTLPSWKQSLLVVLPGITDMQIHKMQELTSETGFSLLVKQTG
jgi:hypothetical protein